MTSIAYQLKNGNYFKIYHKGSEYINTKHGDFKKHQSINRDYLLKKEKYKSEPLFKRHLDIVMEMLRKDTLGELFEAPRETLIKKLVNDIYKNLPINTMFLKKEMDKVLRYELSLTGKSLSRLYKHKIFRKTASIKKRLLMFIIW